MSEENFLLLLVNLSVAYSRYTLLAKLFEIYVTIGWQRYKF